MRFDFTDEQYALRGAVRDVLAAECTPADVRAAWTDETGRSRERLRRLADLGVLGLTVPERHGGLGLGDVEAVLVLEEAGYAGLPEPLLEAVGVAAPLLATAGTPEQQAAWLPRIAGGEVLVALQIGGEPLAPGADSADLLVLEERGQLHALPQDRFRARPEPGEDGARRPCTVAVDPGPDTRLAGDAGAGAAARDRAVWGTAALLCGVGRRLLDMTLEHVRGREQFGRPVGSFQAVQHKLAETHLAVETARSATWYAAYASARGLSDRATAASVAKAAAGAAGRKANHEALQCHGGIGFTWEHDLHLWLKRGRALEAAYGTARDHRAALASLLLG